MEERLVAVIYAGILIGAGIGIVIKAGASTGGVDIPCLIPVSYTHLRDFGVILACFRDEGYTVEWRVINAAEYGLSLIHISTRKGKKSRLLG